LKTVLQICQSAARVFQWLDFQQEKFFGNFNFYVLKQPSFIIKITNGLPCLWEGVSSPDNRRRIEEKGIKTESARLKQPIQTEQPVMFKQSVTAAAPQVPASLTGVLDMVKANSTRNNHIAYQLSIELEAYILRILRSAIDDDFTHS